VIKDGRVYDRFTGSQDQPIAEYQNRWQDFGININWSPISGGQK